MIRTSYKRSLAIILSSLAFFAFASFAHASSVVWNTSKVPILYMSQGATCTSLLHNTSVNITYHTDAVNADTGESVCGATIPAGTNVKFNFGAHTWKDVNWFSTGYNYDTPYGDWSANAAPPAPAYFCTDHNFINSWGTYQPAWGRYSKNTTYVPLRIAPPSNQTVSGLDGFDCGTPAADGSLTCTAKQEGSVTPTFNFSDTYGKFYPAIAYDPAWGYPPCGASTAPLHVPKASTVYLWNQGIATGGYDLLRSDLCSASDAYQLQVPAQSIQCPIIVVPATGGPTRPSVSAAGACTTGTAFKLSFSSTDPDGHQLRYGVDWDGDGSVDQWVPPSGYVPSGTIQSASRTFSVAGDKMVKVISRNDQGASSLWTTYSFSCGASACPSGYVKQGTSCVLSNQCATPPKCSGNDLVDSCTGATIQSCSYGCASGACVVVAPPSATLRATPSLVHSGDTTIVSWASQNTASCTVTGTNGDSWTGTSSSGEASSPILAQTIYTLHCIGYEGAQPPTIDKTAIVNIIPSFNEK